MQDKTISNLKHQRALGRISVGSVTLGNRLPLSLIAGPCVMESEKHLWQVAEFLKKTARELRIPLIFKCSYDKANRSSVLSYRGLGVREGLRILGEVGKELGLPILTDVHGAHEVEEAAKIADVLQIPAFLCRQTDLIAACAKTGKVVNIKKGQFLSPWEVQNILHKALSCGNNKILVTERGTFFGYHNLVVDMRGLDIMKRMGVPVVFDATHSVQIPGGNGRSSGGQREFVAPLARAAVAVGISAVFMEVHPKPERALSDGANSLNYRQLKTILPVLMKIDRTVKTGKEVRRLKGQ